MVVAVVSSLGAPLIPTIATTDHVSLVDAQWSLTITLLSGAVATPTMGRLGDGPRRRTVILVALVIILAGSVLAALPLHFAFLLIGRAMQGIGLGLPPLAMATARSSLPLHRSRPAVALLSISTVAGAGLGYPITGLLAQLWGLHAGFWFGAIVCVLALAGAFWVLPRHVEATAPRLDLVGAVLLAAGLAAALLATSQAEVWGWSSARIIGLFGACAVLLAVWVGHELRTNHPLIELRLLRNGAVLAADVTGLMAGVGVYLLLAAITRFVQTPSSAGYGFGSSIVVAGLILLPFSVFSVLASRVVPVLTRRTSVEAVLPIGAAMFLVAMLVFLLARTSIWEILATMAFAGLGVGCTFAVMPGLIVRAVPAHETGSATSLNQVVRTLGYSIGSALCGTILAAHTPIGAVLPTGSGYRSVALIGCGLWVITIVVSWLLPRWRTANRAVDPIEERILIAESIADAVPLDEADLKDREDREAEQIGAGRPDARGADD
jgi:predicted MFS family arabinose efflux permease